MGSWKKSPFIILAGTIYKVGVSNSMKDSDGKFFDISGVRVGKSTIAIDRDTVMLTPIEKGESWGGVIENNDGIVDLNNAVPGVVYLKSNKISSIHGALLNTEYTLVCTTGPIEISKKDNFINSSKTVTMTTKFFFDGEYYIFI